MIMGSWLAMSDLEAPYIGATTAKMIVKQGVLISAHGTIIANGIS
jgi:hypothetical protein